MNRWDEANMLQNMKNEAVYVTTAAEQRYVYRESLRKTFFNFGRVSMFGL